MWPKTFTFDDKFINLFTRREQLMLKFEMF